MADPPVFTSIGAYSLQHPRTCDQCGQTLGDLSGFALAYNAPGTKLRVPVPGAFHSGACSDQAIRMFAAGFAAGVRYPNA